MKLYILPGACSLAPHIVLRELGMTFELDKVDPKAGKTASGEDYKTVNPLGYVPALRLDNGEVLTEVSAIVQYLADQKPDAKLAPPPGTMERYRFVQWLNFIATELHKGFSPLFVPNLPDSVRSATIDRLGTRLAHVDRHLQGRQYLLGDTFTVADAYLFTITTWLPYANMDLKTWPNVMAHHDRIKTRPAVREALRVETEMRTK